jgi:uncharacterized protein (DUF983 family)
LHCFVLHQLLKPSKITGEDVSADSNVPIGVVKKCPSCGGVLKAFASSCELCGHELADVGANRTISSLSANKSVRLEGRGA